ncbi:hypothetical protein KSS87_000666 [Heliosperma pusillum]|nr:hypothetical protein KSS87_000666 [Heliosperma pusillum]
MPSSKGPKIFNTRSSLPQYFPRKPTSQTICILILITLLIFGYLAISRTLLGHNCNSTQPRSVSVVWERTENSVTDASLLVNGDAKRHKVMGFIGIFTGFGSVGRRRALRQTWLPSDRHGLQRLEEATGLAFRFIIGRTNVQWKMSVLNKEVAQHDDFILLDIEEEYSKLPYKTLAFFKAAYALFDSEFYVKADDDIYLRPDRLSLLLAKERSNPQTYIGCMKKGPVFTDPKLKCFRMFSNEDVTIGSWMLAMNVNHENNHELCSSECTSTSIAVWDIPKCSGLCSPETKMGELHKKEECSGSPTVAE